MRYGEPPRPGQRKLGAAVLVFLTAVIVLAQLARGRREGGQSLEAAYLEMAAAVDDPADRAAHLQAAERKLAQAVGAVVLDAEAIAALSILDGLRKHAGEPAPNPPSPEQLGEDEAVAYVLGLLERGRTREALDWLRTAPVKGKTSRSLTTLQRVAERWQAARVPQR